MFDNEKKLIKKVKKGNQRAFKQMYDAYAEYALRAVYGITRNNNHTSDIVQETFIKIFRNIHQFDETKPFKPWLYQILLNESRRYMKKQNNQPIAVESEQLLDYLNEQNSTVKKDDDLENALHQLTKMYRTVLVLKYINQFTEKEIADLLELNINTVKSRLFKGRQKLRAIIGGVNNEKG